MKMERIGTRATPPEPRAIQEQEWLPIPTARVVGEASPTTMQGLFEAFGMHKYATRKGEDVFIAMVRQQRVRELLGGQQGKVHPDFIRALAWRSGEMAPPEDGTDWTAHEAWWYQHGKFLQKKGV